LLLKHMIKFLSSKNVDRMFNVLVIVDLNLNKILLFDLI